MYSAFFQQNFSNFCNDFVNETAKMFQQNDNFAANFQKNMVDLWQKQDQQQNFSMFPVEMLKQQNQQFRDHIMQIVNEKYGDVTNPHHCLIRFYFNYFFDLFSLENFWFFNSDFWAEYMKTGGKNLVNGCQNFLNDMQKGRVSTVNDNDFEVGKNLATMEGSVVFKNELMEIIHYKPRTEEVHEIPLLIIPPCINKYYILDLREKNSVVKKLLDQGQNVFLISWINPEFRHNHISFDDYILKGAVEAINFVLQTGIFKHINLMSYCIGGTLTAIAASYLRANGNNQIKSIVFLTTLLDFTDVGEAKAFVNEYTIGLLEQNIEGKQGLNGNDMFAFFSMLRAKEMIFQPMMNNYFLGKAAPSFDLLFWNSDSTNLPKKMAKEYLKLCYIDNALSDGKMKIDGKKIDLKKLDIPLFFMSAVHDHITPMTGVANGITLVGKNAKNEFIAVDSGHVASVVLSTNKNYKFWRKDLKKSPEFTKNWRDEAHVHTDESWWDLLHNWQNKLSGKKIKSENVQYDYEVFGKAPGEFVKKKNKIYN